MAESVQFKVATSTVRLQPAFPYIVLVHQQGWDDFGYRTLYSAYWVTASHKMMLLGRVKILQRGNKETRLPRQFEHLDDDFCSLGQTAFYYRIIQILGNDRAEAILTGLRDIAVNPELEQQFRDDPAYVKSLIRFPHARMALAEARRIWGIDTTPPSRLQFSYEVQLQGFDDAHRVRFAFSHEPSSFGRINVLVGKNGTGKTNLLAQLARVLCGLEPEKAGVLEPLPAVGPILTVSYSAFDTFRRPRGGLGEDGLKFIYYYCGLRDANGQINLELAFERFTGALYEIERKARQQYWLDMLQDSGILNTEEHLRELLDERLQQILPAVRALSAGHQLILFVMANLLAKIEERAVILFDEPELHLHPNMLSALLRALHALLDKYAGYAIVATHSPIVLQEIPAACIQIIDREGGVPFVRHYPRESFGANLNEIVRFAFGADQQNVNYLRRLEHAIEIRGEAAVREELDEDLPLNIQLLLRSMSGEG